MKKNTNSFDVSYILKYLPFSLELEKSVIGSVMIDKSVMIHCISKLNDNCFYDIKNRLIYRAMLSLYSKNIPLDFISIFDELKRYDISNTIDIMYLSNIILEVPTAAGAENYVNQLYEYFQKKIIY